MCFHCGLSRVQGSNACCAKGSEQPQSLILGYSAFQMNPLSWVVASWRLYMKMMNQRMHALHHWTYSFIAMKSHFETRTWHANSEGFERLLYRSGSVKCIFFGCVCVIVVLAFSIHAPILSTFFPIQPISLHMFHAIGPETSACRARTRVRHGSKS